MKRALVFSLIFAIGLGIGVAAQSFSGTWDTDIVFDPTPLDITSLVSILEIDYTISGWVFGANSRISTAGLMDLDFNVTGILGAFSLHSFLDFATVTPAFSTWQNVVEVSIAGVDLYAAFALETLTSGIGTGWAVGGHAVAGDVEVWVEADFNISSGLFLTYNYGYTLYDWDNYFDCSDGLWYNGFWSVQTSSCTAAFSNLDIVVELPITCLDFAIWVNFDCTNGFDYIKFMLNDIDLGAGFFQLDDLDITFKTTSKTVTTDFTATFGDAVCVTPYFDIEHTFASITGIDLDALLLSYTYNGVTIKAGELFATVPGETTNTNWWVGFTPSGSLTHYALCAVTDANEFFGVWFDGDSCCGGLTSASIVVFFDGIMGATSTTSSGGIFDYVALYANVEVGIGAGFSIRGGLVLSDDTLETISAGFTFSF